MIYLGTPGRMIGLKCPATQQVSVDDAYRFTTTLEGRRKAQVIPGQRREWSIATSAVTTPAEVAALQEFAQGAWGPGPFHFVSADAPITNLLTPAEAACDPVGAEYREVDLERVLETPPMMTPDGWVARSVFTGGRSLRIAADVPAPPAGEVTVGAYIRGEDGVLRLLWRDATGTSVSQHDVMSNSIDTEHLTLTMTPPGGAVSAELWITPNVQQVGAPSFTWSENYLGRSDGQGCRKAVVNQVAREVTMAVPGGSRYSGLSYSVVEVG